MIYTTHWDGVPAVVVLAPIGMLASVAAWIFFALALLWAWRSRRAR